MGDNISNQDIMDMLTVLVERTGMINDEVKEIKKEQQEMKQDQSEIKEHLRDIDLKLETKIEPKLQAVLENQTEVINQKSTITVVENKQEELKDRVDVIEYAVKQNQSEIEKLKKRA